LAVSLSAFTKLRLPDVVITKNRSQATDLDVLCLALRRLVCPMSLFQLV
jgi:hypothetical protein